MSPRRFARSKILHDKRPVIESMRVCRGALIDACGSLDPTCETRKELGLLKTAIDRLAGHLTGDPTLFHERGSTPPSGMLNGIPVGRREG